MILAKADDSRFRQSTWLVQLLVTLRNNKMADIYSEVTVAVTVKNK